MKRIHVVAAVIERGDAILLSRRPAHAHQGGKWEFPGGKVEAGELPYAGLRRELQEELGIDVVAAQPLIQIAHDYPDKSVLLDVWRVTQFSGAAHGREGQAVQWVSRQHLHHYDFPAANLPIIAAAQLPSTYVISPDFQSLESFVGALRVTLGQGHTLVQIRTPSIAASDWAELLAALKALKSELPVRLMLSSRVAFPYDDVFDGLHLTGRDLQSLQGRPLGYRWLAASCHSPDDIRLAQKHGVDFITLSPLQATSSHPGATGIGIATFANWTSAARLPVFGLGGLSLSDVKSIQAAGGQGVAAIRGFWNMKVPVHSAD